MSRRRRYPVTKTLWLLYAVGSLGVICCACTLPFLGTAVIGQAIGAPPPPEAPPGFWPCCGAVVILAMGLGVAFLSWLFDHVLDERIEMRAETIRRGINE